MFLYELAIELDVRSPELMARATELGMTGILTTSHLTPEQVRELKASYGRGGPPPPPPPPGVGGAPTHGAPGANGGGERNMVAMAALAVVLVVVVGLFAYMVTNGSDEPTGTAQTVGTSAKTTTTTEACQPGDGGTGIGAIGETVDTSDPTSGLPSCDDVAGGLGSDVESTTSTLPGDPIDYPRDKRKFCIAARSSMLFEQAMVEAATSAQSEAAALHGLRDVMLNGRNQWRADVVTMIATGPPRLDVSLELYRSTYSALLDGVRPDMADLDLARLFVLTRGADLRHAAVEIDEAMKTNCSTR
ncbi:MAG: hypothetical protein ABIP03_02305 [Aquihabitans sp.]